MATGYAYGIIDGSIRNINEFVKEIIWDNSLHMRDSNSKTFEPKEACLYLLDKIEYLKSDLDFYENITLEQLKINKIYLEQVSLDYNIKKKNEQDEYAKRLNDILSDVNKIDIDGYDEIISFVKQQLKDTIDCYCKDVYSEDISKITSIIEDLKNYPLSYWKKLRNKKINEIKKEIKETEKKVEEEKIKTEQYNKYRLEFIDYIDKQFPIGE